MRAEVVFDTKGLRGEIRGEYDELKQHDVIFLMSIEPPDKEAAEGMDEDAAMLNPGEQYGLQFVRGCEIVEIKDEEGRLMNDFTGEGSHLPSWSPVFLLFLRVFFW